MEAIFSYFLKSNGLLIIFFLSYYFLLRKETFFNKNRWFLLLGLFASALLPLITFTKTVWIEPTPVVYKSVSNDFVPFIIENETAEQPIDWKSILFYVYIGISVVLIVKILIEIFSFFRIIQFGKKTRTKEALLIDNQSNENPFSFFKHIVFNSQMFTEEELQHIIFHENIHVKEKHSIDVLVAKIFCAVFWMNPIMWFYKKEMLQNLEYIADNKAAAISKNKISYQKTLLKAVYKQNKLSVTNQFYQSLIKKRIVMLNTNPSNQRKSWKYALILPVLSAFMLLFQIETVAQVKEKKVEKTTEIKADTIVWVKDFKDEFESKNDTVKSKKKSINKLYIINDKEYLQSEIPKGTKIEVDGSITELSLEEGIKKYGEKAKNGVLVFEGESTFINKDKNEVPKNLKINFEKGKSYIIQGHKATYDELKDKNLFIYTGSKYSIKEKDNVVIINGDIVENAEMWNDIEMIDTNSKKINDPKYISFENGDIIIYFNETLKISGQPAIDIKDFKISINDTNIDQEDFISLLDMKYNRFVYFEKSKLLKLYTTPLPNYKTFILSNGHQIVVLDNSRIKIPEYPTTFLNNVNLYFNDKKISDNDFIKMNFNDIKSIKVIQQEKASQKDLKIKEIYFYSK